MTEEMVFVSLKRTMVFIKEAPWGYFERLINRTGIFYVETTWSQMQLHDRTQVGEVCYLKKGQI